MAYIIELGYPTIYEKTNEQQMNILRHSESSYHFKNTWMRSLQNMFRNFIVIPFISFFTLSHYEYNRYNSNLKIMYLKLTDIKTEKDYIKLLHDPVFQKADKYISKWNLGFFNRTQYGKNLIYLFSIFLVAYGIFSAVIPILQPNQYKGDIIFIKCNNVKLYQNNEDKKYMKKNDYFQIYLDIKEFDKIIDDIAIAYNAKPFIKKTIPFTSENEEIRSVSYIFTGRDAEQKIKAFLQSLPINVFIHFVYKIDIANTNTTLNVHNKMENDNKIILFPQKEKKIIEKLIPQESLNIKDNKIIEYCDIHTSKYNRLHKNIKYLVDYVKPLKYFQKILPKYFFPKEFSP